MSEIVNNTEIRIVGLKRSGNHAIINWLASHYKGKVCFLNNAKTMTNPFLTFKDKDATRFNKDFYKEFNINKEKRGQFSKKDCLIYSYEDESLKNIFNKNFEKNHDEFVGKSKKRYNILIIRDPFNLFASRITCKNNTKKKNLLEELKIKKLWKGYAREYLGKTKYLGKNKININYNLWFSDEGYRRSIEKKLGLKSNDKKIKEVLSFGEGSSFDGTKFNGKADKMRVLERWRLLVNDTLYKVILNDKKLIELSNKIFGEIPGTKEVIINEKFQNIKFFCSKIKVRVLFFSEITEKMIDYLNQKIGKFGIFLKNYNPKLYFKLKKLKNKLVLE